MKAPPSPGAKSEPKPADQVWFWLAGLAAVALGLTLRILDLAADPPGHWPYGMAWGDEGAWNFPAAFAALKGEWPHQPHLVQLQAPVYAYAQKWLLSVVGGGAWQMRLLSVGSGVATSVVIGRLLWPLSPRAALIGVILYATNFWTITVDRTAQPEALCTLLLALGVLLLARPALNAWRCLASGSCFVLAAAAKPPRPAPITITSYVSLIMSPQTS